MPIPQRLPALLCILLLLSCNDQLPTGPSILNPSRDVSDGAHSSGNPHFFFLTPMVAQPKYTGTFDGSQSPIVQICALANSLCSSPALATFTLTSGPSGEKVKSETGNQQYSVNWHTDQFTTDRSKTYRVTIRVAGTELGHADVVLVSNGNARNISTGDVITLVDGRTLPIRFRIERGAVGVITASQGGTTLLADDAVKLVFPAGAVTTDIGVTARPLPVGIDGTDSSILPGTRYEFGPSPITFAAPVTLILTYPATLPPLMHADRLALCKMANGACVPIAGSHADQIAHTVSAWISTFSEYGITEWPEILRLRPSDEFGDRMFLFTSSGEVEVISERPSNGQESGYGLLNHISWSPDGNRLVYVMPISNNPGCAESGEGIVTEIKIVNADGTGRHTLFGPGCIIEAKWSPGGNEILFLEVKYPEFYPGNRETKIRIVNTSGGAVRTVVDEDEPQFPSWSPDGQRVAYYGRCMLGLRNCIYVVNSDGSDRRLLTQLQGRRGDPRPEWSRDGTRLAFVGDIEIENRRGLWVINVDGTNLNLIKESNEVMAPTWAPAGEDLILFSIWDEGDVSDGVHVIRSDGTGERALYTPNTFSQASWSPDGRRVAFTAQSDMPSPFNDVVWSTWIINVDGSGIQRLSSGRYDYPYWRP